MKLFRAWRRRVVGLTAATVLGLVAVAVTAGGAQASVGGTVTIVRTCGVPTPPRYAAAQAGGLGWMGVTFQPPLETLLGTACTPVTSYYVAVDDVTYGDTGSWSYFQSVPPQYSDAWDILQPGHLYRFAVYAINRVGASAPTYTDTVRDF